ncbi:MAG: DUF4743 domain-containing protein [Gammaproteobacteria bacterium]|nr:DUF4743 domain-containing protein [Gammaproteobacteria bacterium]
MGFLRHIEACNNADISDYIPFKFGEQIIGQIRPEFSLHLQQWPDTFQVNRDSVELLLQELSFAERSIKMASILKALDAQNHISHLHGEQYEATPEKRGEGVVLIDRAAAAYFGIRAFGQHVNGFVRDGKQIKMWLGRRAMDRIIYPGKLDQIAAGGLPYELSLEDNLAKECYEEAGIPLELAQQAKSVSTITYNAESEKGYKPDTLYCYDLELPVDFVPRCTDGEVDSFELMPIEEVMELVSDTDEFKLNCNLVVIDFLIRHGYIDLNN